MWKKKASFLKGFQLLKIVSNMKVGLSFNHLVVIYLRF